MVLSSGSASICFSSFKSSLVISVVLPGGNGSSLKGSVEMGKKIQIILRNLKVYR